MKPLAIIGLDPGTTSAYSIVSLEGELLQSRSAKEFPLSAIIAEIIEVCHPIIVGTDKANVPSFVAQFARKLGTVIVSPKEDIQKEEKHQLFGPGYKGDHTEDSLVAALFAYKKYRPRIQKAQDFISAHQLEPQRDAFLKLALTENFNFMLIKEILTAPSPEQAVIKEAVQKENFTPKDFFRLYRRFQRLQEEHQQLKRRQQERQQKIQELELQNRRLHTQSQHFNQKLDTLLRFKEERLKLQQRELKAQHSMILQLNQKIQGLYTFIERMDQYQLVKKLKTLGTTEFLQRNQILVIDTNDVLYVENPTIYSQKVLDELLGKGIIIVSPVSPGKEIGSQFHTAIFTGKATFENDYFALLERELIEKQINPKDMIQDIISQYREQRGDT